MDHSYYTSKIYSPADAAGRDLWVDMLDMDQGRGKVHGVLSSTHRQAAVRALHCILGRGSPGGRRGLDYPVVLLYFYTNVFTLLLLLCLCFSYKITLFYLIVTSYVEFLLVFLFFRE